MSDRSRACGALVAIALFVPTWALAAPADDVKNLVEAGRATEAYEAAKKTPEALGQPAFDFYFGAAAIDAGHAGEGVLALERYLLNFPDNTSARQLLARGYYLLGENARARQEFEALRQLNPPADVVAAIDRFLELIRVREARYSISTGGYLEFGAGHDSNVNAGPSGANILVPGFGFQPLAAASQKTPADFSSLAAGAFVNYPVGTGVALFAQGQAERKFHRQQGTRQFELGNYAATGGVSLLRDNTQYRLGVQAGVLTVGSRTFRRSLGATAEWQQQIGDAQVVSLGAQIARLRYSTTQSTTDDGVVDVDNSARDADSYSLTAGYKQVLRYRWEPVVSLSLNAGTQHSRTGHPELVPRTWGANGSVNFSPAAQWNVLLGYTYQRSDYRGPDFFAQPDSRRDRYSGVNAAVTYLVSRNWSIRGEALFSRNRSNADAYAFPREVYTVKLRYEFK